MRNDRQNESNSDRKARRNEDPITKAPGAHPIGTGVGAAAGAAAGIGGAAAIGAAAGTVAGPVGTGVGAVAGALIGAAAGKGVAEHINPTEEDAYWRDAHQRESYYQKDYTWDDYSPAYRTGYEGYARLGSSRKDWSQVENDLRSDYESHRGNSRMDWHQASPAVRAAWERVSQGGHSSGTGQGRNLEEFIDSEVYDSNDNRIGTVKCLWSDNNGEAEFIGVNTGWFFGKTHVVPAHDVHVSQRSRKLRLPYVMEKVKGAPHYDPDVELTDEKQQEVYAYYGLGRGVAGAQSQQPQRREQRVTEHTQTHTHESRHAGKAEQADIHLAEESVKVGKREVEAGGVRLRKVIRTEIVNQPVELKREEIVIERVAADQTGAQNTKAFNEEEVYIPLRREEAVVQKETRVTEKVRARKAIHADQREIREEVRKEDVEVESTGEARRSETNTGGRPPARDVTERDAPRSQRRS